MLRTAMQGFIDRVESFLRSTLPKSMRAHRILSGPLKGQRIVTSWHDYPGAITGRTERALLEWFEENVKDGETWLDIGAHYGYTALALSRRVGLQGRVFAFEPVLSTVSCLDQARVINNCKNLEIIPLGLTSGGRIKLQSFPSIRGMVDSTIKTSETSTTVLLAPLDLLWSEISGNDPQIDGIKIDVQGMEIDVLKGMSTTLRSQRPILVIELHQSVSRPQLMKLLESLNYLNDVVPIEPVKGEIQAQYIDNRSYTFYPS